MVNSKRNLQTRQKKAGPSSPDLIQELEELAGQLAALLEPKAVMDAVTHRLFERYGAAVAAIWLVDEAGSALELSAVAGRPALPAELAKVPLEGTFLGRAVEQRVPQRPSTTEDARDKLAAWAKKHRLGFLAAYPLATESRAQGVLAVAASQAPAKSLLPVFRLHATLSSLAVHETRLLAATQVSLAKLSFLCEASKALSSTLDLPELLGRILDVATSQVEAERGTIFLVDEKTEEIWSLIARGLEKQEIRLPLGKGIAGHVAKTGETVNIPDAYSDPRFNPEVDKRTGFRTRNILCLPIRNKAGKVIAALQLLNKKVGAFTDDDVEFLLTLSGHMALSLENAQLHQQLVEKERLERELALARGIQRSLLPETTPAVEGFDVGLLNEPCYEVGGDYYDFLGLGRETLLVVIADVEGKGVSSALIMSNLQATLRALVIHLHSLNEIAEELNRMMLRDTRGGKYLSIFLGLIDLRRKGVHYINCGHVPPVIVRPGHEPIQLREGGMVIGLFEKAEYERGHAKLQEGDVLVLCTDGITEAMNAEQEEYGVERLAQAVQEVADRKASEIVAAVGAEIARFSRLGTHVDDKVMIAIKVV